MKLHVYKNLICKTLYVKTLCKTFSYKYIGSFSAGFPSDFYRIIPLRTRYIINQKLFFESHLVWAVQKKEAEYGTQLTKLIEQIFASKSVR